MAKAFRIEVRHPATPVAIVQQAAPVFTGSSERERFWKELAIRVGQRSSLQVWEMIANEREDSDPQKQYDLLERDLKLGFPHYLKKTILERRGDSGLAVDLKFAVFDITYGSLELILGAIGVEKTAALYGLALPAFISMIEASVPEALGKSLDLPSSNMDFDVSMSELDTVKPASSSTGELAKKDSQDSRVATVSRALSLLNISYLGPILLGIVVLYFAASAALDAMKAATTDRAVLMQQYPELTKQQLTIVSDERKEMARLLGTFVHEAAASNQVLSDSLRKIATEEHGQSLEILRPTVKGHEAQSGSEPAGSVGAVGGEVLRAPR